MKIEELTNISVWASNEEIKLLEKLKKPVKLSSLNEHEQFRILALIRKDLVIKTGLEDPTVVANENRKPI